METPDREPHTKRTDHGSPQANGPCGALDAGLAEAEGAGRRQRVPGRPLRGRLGAARRGRGRRALHRAGGLLHGGRLER